uniref:Uncharacterized protein n=1 Tax=Coturnix japonica TaxID=93934 RepID=A0A8C2UGE2_COTJA
RKPGGRLEVIQLTEAMDSMLEKAGVDELIAVTGPSQLMKAEQNIYNIVFHELIRQVSVDCMERGQLLSKLRSSFGCFADLRFQVPFCFHSFCCRQRYVDLLERVPQLMKALYKKMMAQQLVDRHITEELLYFKECVAQLARSEPFLILRSYLSALSLAYCLLEQYRELYELQRRRLEEQVLAVARERDIWSSAACDLALKDLRDLADLQEETEQFKGILGHVGSEIEHLEESSKEKLQLVKFPAYYIYYDIFMLMNSSLFSYLISTSFPLQPRGGPAFVGTVSLMLFFQMLKEDTQLYTGEANIAKTESLKSAARIQKHWTELGETVLSRHRDLTGALLPQHAALEEINQRACELYQQYNTRISGNNGTVIFLTDLVRSMEDWLFKAQKLTRGSGMHETELQAFYHMIPSWLAQVDALMSIIGSSQLHKAKNDMEPHCP